VNREGDRSGKTEGFLEQCRAYFVRPRQIEIIQYLITCIFQSLKRRILRKVVRVRMLFAPGHETALAHDGLHRNVQWKVENLMLGLWANLSERGKIVLKMLDHIEH